LETSPERSAMPVKLDFQHNDEDPPVGSPHSHGKVAPPDQNRLLGEPHYFRFFHLQAQEELQRRLPAMGQNDLHGGIVASHGGSPKKFPDEP